LFGAGAGRILARSGGGRNHLMQAFVGRALLYGASGRMPVRKAIAASHARLPCPDVGFVLVPAASGV
jgi:hypothetical protein